MIELTRSRSARALGGVGALLLALGEVLGLVGYATLSPDQPSTFHDIAQGSLWVSFAGMLLVFAAAATVLVVKGRPRAGDELVGEPLPAEVLDAQAEALADRSEAEQPGGGGGAGRAPEGVRGASQDAPAGASDRESAAGPSGEDLGTFGERKGVPNNLSPGPSPNHR